MNVRCLFRHPFKFGDPEPFFRILYMEAMADQLEFTDLLTMDHEIKQAIFEFVRQMDEKNGQNRQLRNHPHLI